MNNPALQQYVDSSRGADTKTDDMAAALSLAQNHPKSMPTQNRDGMAIDANTARDPETGVAYYGDLSPGIGVGGASPIGAFES